jgi:hypothetical protein
MKQLKYILIAIAVAIGSFLTGFLIRQPKLNKLKKQLETMQHDNQRLIALCTEQQQKFRKLLVQHKALKAMQYRKLATSKEKIKECLTMQYAIYEYVSLLIKRVEFEQELSKEEIIFFSSFEKFIDGKQLNDTDKVKIAEFVKVNHSAEIRNMRECDFSAMLADLQAQPEHPNLIFCSVKLSPKKKSIYYLTDDPSIKVRDMIVVPVGKKKETVVEVLAVEYYDEDTTPMPLKDIQHVKCKFSGDELLSPKRNQ